VFEAQLAEVELALVDTAQQFDASDGDRRGSEPLEAEHRSQPRFHAAMILLDQVVKYFDERTFVPSGIWPSAFISSTARCEAA